MASDVRKEEEAARVQTRLMVRKALGEDGFSIDDVAWVLTSANLDRYVDITKGYAEQLGLLVEVAGKGLEGQYLPKKHIQALIEGVGIPISYDQLVDLLER